MGTVLFPNTVALCVAVAFECARTDGKKPEMLFVKDDGIYLMPSRERTEEQRKEQLHIVYAKGFDPKKDADVWDRARDAVGGDDFGERIDASDLRRWLGDGATSIKISVTANRLAVSADVPAGTLPPMTDAEALKYITDHLRKGKVLGIHGDKFGAWKLIPTMPTATWVDAMAKKFPGIKHALNTPLIEFAPLVSAAMAKQEAAKGKH